MRRSDCQTGALVFTATLVTYVVFFTGTGQNRTSETSSLFETANEEGGFYQELNSLTKKPAVNELKGHELPRVSPYQCVRQFYPSPVDGGETKEWTMCGKGPETYLSNQIYTAGIWDYYESQIMENMTANYPGGLFLDIGSNIGPFSIQMANNKYRVMSVDPTAENLAHIRFSAYITGVEQYIRFVHNTVSDEKMTLIPWTQDPNNDGFLVWLPEEEAQKKTAEEQANMGKGVESTKFSDLLNIIEEETIILKIDVEGAECKVLSEYLNSEKPKSKFIPYIHMEWSHCGHNAFGLCPDLNRLLQGFEKSGYRPVVGGTAGQDISTDDNARWTDILWRHKDAVVNV